MTTLDDQLLAAHASDDKRALVSLYTQAADIVDDVDAACYFLTHAYIFALELGHADATVLHARLAANGRI